MAAEESQPSNFQYVAGVNLKYVKENPARPYLDSSCNPWSGVNLPPESTSAFAFLSPFLGA